jgi:hypothetical protein
MMEQEVTEMQGQPAAGVWRQSRQLGCLRTGGQIVGPLGRMLRSRSTNPSRWVLKKVINVAVCLAIVRASGVPWQVVAVWQYTHRHVGVQG